MNPTPPNFQSKFCVDCRLKFAPICGAQKRCDICRNNILSPFARTRAMAERTKRQAARQQSIKRAAANRIADLLPRAEPVESLRGKPYVDYMVEGQRNRQSAIARYGVKMPARMREVAP